MDVQTAATLADLRQQLDAARREIDFLRGFANNPDVETLRGDLDAARADAAMWQKAHAEQGVVLTRERSRADVLAAALQSARDTFIHIAEYWNGSHNQKALADALDVMGADANDAAIAAGNALDPAKFERKP